MSKVYISHLGERNALWPSADAKSFKLEALGVSRPPAKRVEMVRLLDFGRGLPRCVEPASVLLDRIRAQRAAAPKAKRGGRRKVSA